MTTPDRFLTVGEVVDAVRFLIRLGDNVKIGPQVLVRTYAQPDGTLSGAARPTGNRRS